MGVERFAGPVAARVREIYGDTSDLSEPLVNSLCNIYYFAEKALKLDFGGLTDVKELFPGRSDPELMSLYLNHMKFVAFAVEHAPELVTRLRSLRGEAPSAYEYFEEFTLDLVKYQIDDAAKKSGIRRMIERKLSRPIELPGLAAKIGVTWRRPSSQGRR